MSDALNFAWIIDPLESLNLTKDSSLELMRAAAVRGHHLFVIEPDGLQATQDQVWAECKRIHYRSENQLPEYCQAPIYHPLSHFHAVLMRKDPPFDAEYLYATHLLELAELQGVRVINRPRALRDFNEKLVTLRFPHLTPPTLVARQVSAFREFLDIHQDIILKPLDGMGGRGIFRIQKSDSNFNVIWEMLSAEGTRTLMAQRYLPEIINGDKRILMVDGQPLPYVLARIPSPGENRGNLAAGGTGRVQPLSSDDQIIAEAVGPFLRQSGILLAGLDVIGQSLTEINVTSPTCLREIRDQTGIDGARQVIEVLEKACRHI